MLDIIPTMQLLPHLHACLLITSRNINNRVHCGKNNIKRNPFSGLQAKQMSKVIRKGKENWEVIKTEEIK
jgi:hypothetical protein